MTSARWRIDEGSPVDLDAIDPASLEGAPGGKERTAAASELLRVELSELQERLYAENARAMLVVLQAMDAGGKDGTIRKVFTGVNPQGVRVEPFGPPSEEELAHDFLWRAHARCPRTRLMTIFNRSYYEDVVVVRVKGLVPEEVWRRRYAIIEGFERGLHAERTHVVKLFLHISKDEQERRLQARLEDPTKRWKYRATDLQDRALWDQYMAAYRNAIAETSTEQAPWYVIPADHKWYRDWAVLTVLVETLGEMDPRYPSA
jgi:PPK2 family polyphosphate:nucleotide phosphotransferase